jgi:hypothetical protein
MELFRTPLRILAGSFGAALAVVACSAPTPKPNGASSHQPSSPTDGEDPGASSPGTQPDDPGPSGQGPASPAASSTPAQGPAPPAGPLPAMTPRCATRLSIARTGRSPSSALLASTDLGGAIDTLVASPDFAERYARFVNSEFNDAAATDATADPIYYLAKFVISNDKPWSDLFVGGFQVKASGTTAMTVTPDPNGLGYFRTDAWRKRYAGNESSGLMLVGAFRIFANTTGLQLVASVGAPDDDRTVTGRMGSPCRACHFDSWFALDKAAALLPRKKGQDDTVTFTAPSSGPQQLMGKSIADDKALLTTLVGSDGWRFQQCREVFKFLYGRPENKCEAQTFDRCVDALTQKQTIRAAVIAAAKDPAVCR